MEQYKATVYIVPPKKGSSREPLDRPSRLLFPVLNTVQSHGKHKPPPLFAFAVLDMVTHIVAHTKSNGKSKNSTSQYNLISS